MLEAVHVKRKPKTASKKYRWKKVKPKKKRITYDTFDFFVSSTGNRGLKSAGKKTNGSVPNFFFPLTPYVDHIVVVVAVPFGDSRRDFSFRNRLVRIFPIPGTYVSLRFTSFLILSRGNQPFPHPSVRSVLFSFPKRIYSRHQSFDRKGEEKVS